MSILDLFKKKQDVSLPTPVEDKPLSNETLDTLPPIEKSSSPEELSNSSLGDSLDNAQEIPLTEDNSSNLLVDSLSENDLLDSSTSQSSLNEETKDNISSSPNKTDESLKIESQSQSLNLDISTVDSQKLVFEKADIHNANFNSLPSFSQDSVLDSTSLDSLPVPSTSLFESNVDVGEKSASYSNKDLFVKKSNYIKLLYVMKDVKQDIDAQNQIHKSLDQFNSKIDKCFQRENTKFEQIYKKIMIADSIIAKNAGVK